MNNEKVNALIDRHEMVLLQLLSELDIPASRLKEAIAYSLFPGGKRLRPVLVYLCGEMVRAPLAALDYIAAAVELTHCYSLVHDDLPAMDNDDMRRGKPSCHRAFDEATAILVGDGMQALAIEILLSKLTDILAPAKVIEITRELVRASGPTGMVSGQSLDLSELSNSSIDEHTLKKIHQLKTGKLILSCINMALAAGSPSHEEIRNLRLYGNHLGLVFQMQDDYLDAYASIEHLGKGRASDLANDKITYAQLYPQKGLLEQINQHFDHAKTALQQIGSTALELLHLNGQLHQRTSSF
ncbi:geranyltranstransferase [Legionella quinlivanii]|uniref:Geranyltranstransferase n=1 Tax=Legionella quinlivanii TaxID=45073 RepID=A0A0W0Y3L9_9GAMM|nr:farnesyl diphosphate synthase [Legionella quinlivanii]KTD51413.1 geranyltranstransferase [Legionella quinlivanii]MCW8451605.1 polyprenyl synthetase family protein [Legionella quinlivanii]SEG11459.1 farnesyl diphosphate synthase [Legionella quinlivanii DSM 21216]STY10173.1 geranyltranstransferase [Legionella quinlivanii]